MREIRSAYKILARKPDRKRHLEDGGINGWIILESVD
jgi:hypothetical protein